jgi:hypothetical protein
MGSSGMKNNNHRGKNFSIIFDLEVNNLRPGERA